MKSLVVILILTFVSTVSASEPYKAYASKSKQGACISGGGMKQPWCKNGNGTGDTNVLEGILLSGSIVANAVNSQISAASTNIDKVEKALVVTNTRLHTVAQKIETLDKAISETVNLRISDMQKNVILQINAFPKPVEWSQQSYDNFKKALIEDLQNDFVSK